VNELAGWAGAFGVSLTSAQVEQFAVYESLLLAWNERISLTAIREPREIRIRHFLDSLSCVVATGPLDERALIDVGSGAGFPGLPLKILFPTLKLTLVESVAKKARFLEHVAGELGLRDVTIVADRAEAVGREAAYRERYDWAVARAVAELRVLVELLLPLCRVGGAALAQKGESAATEVAAASEAIAVLGGGEARISTIQLPETDQVHYLVVIPKVRPTGDRYPRRPGIPAKRPL
jgi:16S rRNA (guanine527-N7)-methyltransferase